MLNLGHKDHEHKRKHQKIRLQFFLTVLLKKKSYGNEKASHRQKKIQYYCTE